VERSPDRTDDEPDAGEWGYESFSGYPGIMFVSNLDDMDGIAAKGSS
jgi:hypothetical protein